MSDFVFVRLSCGERSYLVVWRNGRAVAVARLRPEGGLARITKWPTWWEEEIRRGVVFQAGRRTGALA